jgi:short-subunit dehydrogenase
VDIPEKNLRHQFEVNVLGPILLTQLVARNMVKKGKGRIVFMSSVAGLTTDPFTGAYSASKHLPML